jgi:hypothetical protein
MNQAMKQALIAPILMVMMGLLINSKVVLGMGVILGVLVLLSSIRRR